MDKIIVKNAKFCVNLGVTDDEQSNQQFIFVDVTLDCSTDLPGRTDNINDAINYATVHRNVGIAVAKPRRTIEAMANAIFEQLKLNIPFNYVTIQLRKPDALKAKDVEYAAVEITRSYHGTIFGQ